MKVRRTLFREIAQLGPVFKGIIDVMGSVVDAVTWLLEQFNKLSDWLESHGIAFRQWIGRIIGVVSALGLLAAGLRLVIGFLELRFPSQLGPLFKGIIDVSKVFLDLVTGLLRAFNRFSGWLESRGVPGFNHLIGTLIGLVALAGIVRAVFTRLIEGLTRTGGSIRSLWRLVTGIFKQDLVCVKKAGGCV